MNIIFSQIAAGMELTGICVSCLGILQEQYCKRGFMDEILSVVRKQDFEFSAFLCSISTPVCLLLREHAVWLTLSTAMPLIFTGGRKDDIVPIKDIWKWVNGPTLAMVLEVPFDLRSTFEVLLTFVHPVNMSECDFLYDLYPNTFHRRKNTRQGFEVFNRTNVTKAIEDVTDNRFRKLYRCPPRPLAVPCDCDPITCLREAIYIAGRYNKYSRRLSQTPWLIDGVRKSELSIEEHVCRPLMDLVKAAECRFSASGREDVDVLMLGSGRPFVVEFINPRRVIFTREQLDAVQKMINDSTTDIAVRDVQVLYSHLCWGF